MKKTEENELESKKEPLMDCNCLNCRLGRIEDQLNHVQHVLEDLTLPTNPGRGSSKTKKNW